MIRLLAISTILMTLLLTSVVFAQDNRGAPTQNRRKPVISGFGTGQSWRDMTRGERWAWVEGFVDGLILFGERTPYMEKFLQWVVDGNFDTEQLSAMVTLCIDAHPESWNQPLHFALWAGLNGHRLKTSP